MQQWLLIGSMHALGESCNKLIDPVPFRIGRRPDASLTLPRASVSGIHAELFTIGDQLFARDLGSTNGTFVNGERVFDVTELKPDDVIQFADVALRVSHSSSEREAHTMPEDFCDQALGRVQFDKLMREEVVTPYYQPIVNLHSGATEAFEVLARSRLIGLETPSRMFAVASDLHLEAKLSDLMRRKGIEFSHRFNEVPPIYLNTHPAEFENDADWDWVIRLREMAPSQTIIIEIHEAAVTDVISISRFRALLKDYDMGLAFDDFGAGQARIAELIAIRPDCVKVDRSLITQLDLADVSKRRFVRGLIDAIRDIGVIPLAEGIETLGEQQICVELGFELAQGFFLGMPRMFESYHDWTPFPSENAIPIQAPGNFIVSV
jgi:EAL domain-containing protein (putative c-di-GMP-specific phosphodiesterase class I)